jgi:putative SOS response-associated peptidase YedK
MCGRFSCFTPLDALRERFDAEAPDEQVYPRYNAAPGQKMIVIPLDDPHKMHFSKWGLIPHWAKDPKIGYKLINARSETLKEKPAFRGSLQKGRCLVLADGFYEWGITDGRKTPYRIELNDRKPFSMAGLCSRWKDAAGQSIDTFTIITTDANETVGTIHNRMPVIFNREQEIKWLDPLMDLKEIGKYLMPYSEHDMEMFPISILVNSPKNDIPEIIKPVAWQ